MKEIGQYNTELKLFKEELPPINMSRLLFQRWLVQNGKGERLPESKPLGEIAFAFVLKTGETVETTLRREIIGGH